MIASSSQPGLPEPVVEELATLYRSAQKRMAAMILHPPGGTENSQRYAQARAAGQAVQIDELLKRLGRTSDQWVAKNLPGVIRRSTKLADQQAKEAGVRRRTDATQGRFDLIERRTAEVFARQIASDLGKARIAMGQRGKNLLRDTALVRGWVDLETGELRDQALGEADIRRILAGGAIEGAPRETIRKLRDELKAIAGDRIGIIDRNGGVIEFDVGYYAKMVATTQTRQASVLARHQRLRDLGVDLVMVIGSSSENFCTEFVGKVFSISGNHPKYPPLADLPWGGPPFHPNCSKTTRPFIEDLADPEDLERAVPDQGSRSMLKQTPSQAQRIYRQSLKAQTLDRPQNQPSQRELDGFSDLREPRRFEDDQPEVSQAWGKANYREWAAELGEVQRQVIGEYQAGDAREINRELWKHKDPAQLTPKVRAQVQAIDQALAKARVPQDIVVYRGMKNNLSYHAQAEKLLDTDLNQDSGGFHSTALRRQSAMRYMLGGEHPVLMEIIVPKGTHAAYLSAVTQRQLLDDELVIDRHHRLRVVSVINQPGKPLLMKVEVINE